MEVGRRRPEEADTGADQVSLVIVPNQLRDAINAAIDKELAGRPCDPAERLEIYHALLSYFDRHGTIPEFTLREPTK